MSDLTADQITDLRRNYIRDEWLDSPSFRGVSDYNVAKKREFFSDDQIKAIDDEILADWEISLDDLEAIALQDRKDEGDTEPDATTAAAAFRSRGRFHLIAAICIQRMAADPGFRDALRYDPKKGIESVFGGWEQLARNHFLWVTSRTSGIEIER